MITGSIFSVLTIIVLTSFNPEDKGELVEPRTFSEAEVKIILGNAAEGEHVTVSMQSSAVYVKVYNQGVLVRDTKAGEKQR